MQDAVERRTQPERWPNHLLFVAGMPKSGTTWLAELLEGVPHYRSRPFSDPDGCVLRHDICDAVFESLPGDLYSVVKLHTRATPENLAVLDHFGLPAVVMHRDLRDQAVSRYFHVKVDPEHRHFELYNTASEAEGLRHAIEHSTGEYREWIEQWLPVLEAQPERFLEVRYEWLREDPAGQLTRALAFFGIDLPAPQIAEIVRAVAANTRFDLQASLRRNQTARAGVVGGWRQHFDDEHVRLFKERSGDLLVRLGYERDVNWTR